MIRQLKATQITDDTTAIIYHKELNNVNKWFFFFLRIPRFLF